MPPLDRSHTAHFVFLPLVLGLERLGYAATRSALLPFLLSEWELDPPEIQGLFAVLDWTPVVAFLLGAVVAAGAGPYVGLAMGVVATGVGCLLFSTLPPDSMGLSMGLLGLGRGLFLPACFALAAAQLGYRDWARTAFFMGLLLVMQCAPFVGLFLPPLAAEVGQSDSLFMAMGIGEILLLAPIGVLWALGRSQIWPEPKAEDFLQHLGIAVGVMGLLVGFLMASAVGNSAFFANQHALNLPFSLMTYLAPVFIPLGALLFLVWALVAAQMDLKVPPLGVAALGMITMVAAVLLAYPDVALPLGNVGLSASIVGFSLCECVVLSVVYAQFGARMHWRVTPVLFGIFGCLGLVISYGMNAAFVSSPNLSLMVAGFLSGVGGLILLLGTVAGRHTLMGTRAAPDPDPRS